MTTTKTNKAKRWFILGALAIAGMAVTGCAGVISRGVDGTLTSQMCAPALQGSSTGHVRLGCQLPPTSHKPGKALITRHSVTPKETITQSKKNNAKVQAKTLVKKPCISGTTGLSELSFGWFR